MYRGLLVAWALIEFTYMIPAVIRQPEFFDIFGLAVFSFIIYVAVWGLKTRRSFPRWILILLAGIGIAGLFVDGVIVFTFYLK